MNELTKLIRDIIRQKDLIDTGLMVGLTTVQVQITDRVVIDIMTTSYFKYMYIKYGIYQDFINSQVLKEYLEKIYFNILNDSVEEIVGDIDISTSSSSVMKMNQFNYKPLMRVVAIR